MFRGLELRCPPLGPDRDTCGRGGNSRTAHPGSDTDRCRTEQRVALRLQNSVLRGEIDNRVRGRILGKLWLVGVHEPLHLALEGNCWRDMAGSVTRFEVSGSAIAPSRLPAVVQSGFVGDMTVSRKQRALQVPLQDALRLIAERRQVPSQWSNGLYFEWFSRSCGRVIVEATRFQAEISLPEWHLSQAEELEQQERNADRLRRLLDSGSLGWDWLESTGPVDAVAERLAEEFGRRMFDGEGNPHRDRELAAWLHTQTCSQPEPPPAPVAPTKPQPDPRKDPLLRALTDLRFRCLADREVVMPALEAPDPVVPGAREFLHALRIAEARLAGAVAVAVLEPDVADSIRARLHARAIPAIEGALNALAAWHATQPLDPAWLARVQEDLRQVQAGLLQRIGQLGKES